MSNIVAIITARGGSKGLPRKNVLDLNGKPLIAHTIDAAKKSGIFSKIVVTTDDDEIKNISLSFGADVIDRPDNLSTDTASSLDAIEHTLNKLEKNGEIFTHFILLQPTSPLRVDKHINKAWEKYCSENVKSLVSVVEVGHSPQKMLIEDENGKIKPLTLWEHLSMPRQKLPKAYLPNGAIYINKIADFFIRKNIFEHPLALYKMDEQSSLDIDNQIDFDKVENFLKKKLETI